MSANSRVTRSSNKSAHPGMPDVDDEVLGRPVPKPRRTKAQIAADNAAAAAKKLAKLEEEKSNQEKKKQVIKRIAELENEMDDDEQQALNDVTGPPAKKTVEVPQHVGTSNTIQKPGERKTIELFPTGAPIERDENFDSSDIEYMLSPPGAAPKSKVADTTSTKKAKSKPESTRTSIDKARRVLVDTNMDPDISAKRKADEDGNVLIGKKGKHDRMPADGSESGAVKRKDPDLDVFELTHARPKKAKLSRNVSRAHFGNNADDENRNPAASPLTGFRRGWQPSKTTKLPTIEIDSDSDGGIVPGISGEAVEVDRFDYAADESEDDTKEATSTSTKPPTKKNGPLPSKSLVKIEFRKPTVSSSTRVTKARLTFNNSDLPPGYLQRWQTLYIPALHQYLGTLKNPWLLDNLLPKAQRIWDKVFPNCPRTLALTGEPIFYLTKQRSYEWRGSFAAAAITAVEEFWNSDPQYASAEDRANYVEWGIPAQDEEPSPFTWASVNESDSDNIIYKGAFQSPAILSTFSPHFASISNLPPHMQVVDAPEGTLSIATTSVERAFKMWSTGTFVKPTKADGISPENFTTAWAERTALYVSDIEQLPPKTWKKIRTAATKIIEEKKKARSRPAVQAAKVPARRQIIDADESDY